MSLELTIVTPEREVLQEGVAGLVLPGSEGDFGVLPEHERLLSALRIGEVRIERQDGSVQYAAMSGGFADVSGRSVVVLAETCELAQDIDVARAERARARAERELQAREESRQRIYAAALERAVVRIQVGGRR